MSRILVVDDDAVIRTYFSEILQHQGYDVDVVASAQKGLSQLEKSSYQLIFCDFRLPDMDADDFLRSAKQNYPRIPVVIITGYSNLETAVNVMKLGAFNYLIKPVDAEVLLAEASSALEWHFNKMQKAKGGKRSSMPDSSDRRSDNDFVEGISEESKRVRKQVEKVSGTNYSVLVCGESGTGKELVALTLHQLSHRKKKPFVAVDCGVLTPELARSELFGHTKGSFTGAETSKQGKFQQADGGTLFLDEIANLSYEVQGYLLRAIQEGKVSPVGSQELEDVDVRIVAASNVPLKRAVAEGRFREDLYHRLHEFSIELPPLREVKDEIMHYAHNYLHQVATELGVVISGFDSDVMKLLRAYPWPGNFRELKNVVRRSCLFAEGNMLTIDSLHPEFVRQAEAELQRTSRGISGSADESGDSQIKQDESLKRVSDRAEREKIMRVLERTNYNKSATARTLDIDRKTLYNKLKKYKISD